MIPYETIFIEKYFASHKIEPISYKDDRKNDGQTMPLKNIRAPEVQGRLYFI